MDFRLRNLLGVILTLSPIVCTGCVQMPQQPVVAYPASQSEILMNNARLEESRGNLIQAMKLYSEVNQQNPRNVDCLQRMGVIATHMNMPESANRYYRLAYEINPNNAELLADMGYSAFQSKEYEKAEVYLELSVRLNSSNPRVIDNLAIARAWRNKDEASLIAFKMVHDEAEAKRRLAAIQASRAAVVAHPKTAVAEPIVAVKSPSELAIEIPVLPPVVESAPVANPNQSTVLAAISTQIDSPPASFETSAVAPATMTANDNEPQSSESAAVAVELPPPPSPPTLQASKRAIVAISQPLKPHVIEPDKPFKPGASSKPMTACKPINAPQPLVSQISASESILQVFMNQQLEEGTVQFSEKQAEVVAAVIASMSRPDAIVPVEEKTLKSNHLDQPLLADNESIDCDGTHVVTPNWQHHQGSQPESIPETVKVSAGPWRKTSSASSTDDQIDRVNVLPISHDETSSDHQKNDGTICLVTLFEKNRLEPGSAAYSFDYQSQHFQFATESARQRFIQCPERYLPANEGIDVVAKSEWGNQTPGSFQFPSWYQRRLYLFSNRENLERFRREPFRFVGDK